MKLQRRQIYMVTTMIKSHMSTLILVILLTFLLIIIALPLDKRSEPITELPKHNHYKQRQQLSTKKTTQMKKPVRRNGRCNNCYKWKISLLRPFPKDYCNERKGVPVDLIVLVTTGQSRQKQREAMRTVYSGDKDYGERMRLIFLLGTDPTGNKTNDRMLLEESKKHKDIMVFDTPATYYDMYKLNFNGFDWVTKHCAKAKFLVKLTDDVFLNIAGWLKTFEKFGTTELHDVHFGTCNYGTDMPIRDMKHRFGVSWANYPFPRYPSYCAGGGLFMSVNMTRDVLAELGNLAIVTAFDDLNLGTALRLSGHCVCNMPGGFLSYEIQRNRNIKKAFASREPKQCSDISSVNPFLGLHMHHLPPERIVSLWKLKHCYADSYPRSLKCARRYTCKQDNFHVEPVL